MWYYTYLFIVIYNFVVLYILRYIKYFFKRHKGCVPSSFFSCPSSRSKRSSTNELKPYLWGRVARSFFSEKRSRKNHPVCFFLEKIHIYEKPIKMMENHGWFVRFKATPQHDPASVAGRVWSVCPAQCGGITLWHRPDFFRICFVGHLAMWAM